jgi:hypothetical protein
MCTPVTPAVPYLLLGLQDVQWAVGNSRGAHKLAQTPHINQNKKKKKIVYFRPLIKKTQVPVHSTFLLRECLRSDLFFKMLFI